MSPPQVDGVGERLGQEAAGTADPNWAKRCSIPHTTLLSNKTRGGGVGRGNSFHSSTCSEAWVGIALPVVSDE